MVPRNYSTQVILVFYIVILAVVSIHSNGDVNATQVTGYAYCASSPDQPEVYFSQIFNAEFRTDRVNDTTPIGNEYNEYLKGRWLCTKSQFGLISPRSAPEEHDVYSLDVFY